MNKEQKTAVVAEVAAQIEESEAVFAVDYRGISVPQAAELRTQLSEAGARFRIVKNTLTMLAADQAGAESLKETARGAHGLHVRRRRERRRGPGREGARPVPPPARRARVQGRRDGRRAAHAWTSSRPSAGCRRWTCCTASWSGAIASPITGLVRTLNALLSGVAIQLQQIVEQGLLPAGESGGGVPSEADQEAQADQAEEEAAQSAEGEETESSSEESAPRLRRD